MICFSFKIIIRNIIVVTITVVIVMINVISIDITVTVILEKPSGREFQARNSRSMVYPYSSQ